MRVIARRLSILIGIVACFAAIAVDAQAQERRPSDRFGGPSRSKVIGGLPAQNKDWPYFASLRYNDSANRNETYVCGGTAISPEWILTAGHCLIQLTDGDSLFHPQGLGVLEVVFGTDDLRKVTQEQVYQVDRFVIHPKYLEAYKSSRTKLAEQRVEDGVARQRAQDEAAIEVGHDIALIKIRRPWTGSLVRLSLSPDTDPVADGIETKLAGFGLVNASSQSLPSFTRANGETVRAGSAIMQTVSLPTVSTDQCLAKYRTRYPRLALGAEQVCAGLDAGGKDSCTADSGGPLMSYDSSDQKYQIGLVSWGGEGCAAPGWYGIYTRVSAYKDWIGQHVASVNAVPKGLVAVASAQPAEARLAFTRAAILQLSEELAVAQHRVKLNLPQGPKVRLGNEYAVEIETEVAGRLILIDIDAAGKVTQIFPNEFTTSGNFAVVSANQKLRVPPVEGGWGFRAFRAEEPLGSGTLIALVVPENFPFATTVTSAQHLSKTKGFAAVQEQTYFMNVLDQVVQTAAKTKTQPSGRQLPGWALGFLKYDIGR